MRFSCDRCGKLFSTASEPVAGRAYRVPCRCGNVILLYRDKPGAAPSPLAPRKPSIPPRLPRADDRAVPAARSRRKGDVSTRTVPVKADAAPEDAPTAIVSPPAGIESRRSGGGDARNPFPFDPERSDVSRSSAEPAPETRGLVGGAADRVETFVLLHVTPGRTIAAASVAAAVGLAIWISVATSGSTTTTSVLSLRSGEPSRQEPVPETHGARTPSHAPRGARASAHEGASSIEIGDPMRLDPSERTAEASSASAEERPTGSATAEPSARPPEREPVAAEPLVFSFGRDPAVHTAPGATASNGGAADDAGRATRSRGRAPTTREAMAALGERASALEDCIDAAAQSGDAQWLGRRVRVVMTFGPDGRVTSADVEDEEMAETTLAGCIRNAAKRVSLPPFGGAPVSVAVPLRLGAAR